MKNGSLRKLHLMTKPCNFASQKVGVVFQTTQKTPQLYIPLSDGIEIVMKKVFVHGLFVPARGQYY